MKSYFNLLSSNNTSTNNKPKGPHLFPVKLYHMVLVKGWREN